MPLYEYECSKCGQTFEALVAAHKADRHRCETCGGRCRRLLSPPAIIFKGSGFYTTDYARKGQTRDKDEGASDKKSGDKKAEPKS